MALDRCHKVKYNKISGKLNEKKIKLERENTIPFLTSRL